MLSKLLAYSLSKCLKSEKLAKDSPILFLLDTLVSVCFVCGGAFIFLLTLKLFVGLRLGDLVLISSTFLLELYVVLKCVSLNSYKLKIGIDKDIECDKGVIFYTKSIIKDQLSLVLPFLMIFGMFVGADINFYIHSIISVISLSLMLGAWILLLINAVDSIKKSFKNLSQNKEFVITILLLIVSAIFILICRGLSVGHISSASLLEFINQTLLTIQSSVFAVNSNVLICINILTLILIMQGLVLFIIFTIFGTKNYIENIVIKCSARIDTEVKKYYNNILKSCLARSPTAL
ncbi:MAG: hypothetical protein IJA61_03580 [Clostridia bacterium]|nr:hypothetical protein [Clostridia bacterium]